MVDINQLNVDNTTVLFIAEPFEQNENSPFTRLL